MKYIVAECNREDCAKLFHYTPSPRGGRPRKYCSKRCYRFSLSQAQQRYRERKKKREAAYYGIW